jgi:predicted GNAT family acetyltransferase
MSKPAIRILQPGDEAALEAFLLPRIESSMFLISNMRTSGLIDNAQAYTGTYAAAFEEERIIGVAAHYWNQKLVFQAPVHLDSLWRAAVKASQRPIGGLIGPNDQVTAATEALEMDESKIQLDETENLYSLQLEDLIVPGSVSSGEVRGRQMEPRDLERVTQWTVAYSIEALGEKDSPQLWQRCRASVERSLEEGRTWVLEDHGHPVACSSFNSAIQEAVQIGGVWTPPELRRRGYGRSVVAASLLDARLEGVEKAILFTGESNIAAQKAYVALGFRHIGDYRIILFRTPLEII